MSIIKKGDLVTYQDNPYVVIRLDTPEKWALLYPGDNDSSPKTRLMQWAPVSALVRRGRV
jgi:signal peptidase I